MVSRGSKWFHSSKKKGFALSMGAYVFKNKKRSFQLTEIHSGKKKLYRSAEHAAAKGWSVASHRK